MRGDEGIAPYEGVYKQHAKLQFEIRPGIDFLYIIRNVCRQAAPGADSFACFPQVAEK